MSVDLLRAANTIMRLAVPGPHQPLNEVEQWAIHLARDFLRQHEQAECDRQPITAEWLQSVGFENKGTAEYPYWKIGTDLHMIKLAIYQSAHSPEDWNFFVEDEANCVQIAQVSSRRSVRDLCHYTGQKLKSDDPTPIEEVTFRSPTFHLPQEEEQWHRAKRDG